MLGYSNLSWILASLFQNKKFKTFSLERGNNGCHCVVKVLPLDFNTLPYRYYTKIKKRQKINDNIQRLYELLLKSQLLYPYLPAEHFKISNIQNH